MINNIVMSKLDKLGINYYTYQNHHIFLCKKKACEICSIKLCPKHNPLHLFYSEKCPSCYNLKY